MAEITRDTTGNKIGTGTGGIELAPASTEPVTINNGVMLPDGSLGEPSVRFSDDTNCGVLSLTNDQINMAAHGVELTRFTGVASAVNYLELKNSITTADLSIGAVGTDTNISINLIPKGSGTLKVGGTNVALVGANLSTFTNDSGFITGFTETNDLTAAVTWANIPDANVPQTAVTQHQAALFITESQISDLGSYLTDVVGDTTPQLGGNLDVQANSITTSTVNGGITLTPNGTGDVTLGNFVFDADQTIGAGQDDYVLTYDNASGKISLEAAGGGGGATGYHYSGTITTAPSGTGEDTIVIGDGAAAGSTTNSIVIGAAATASANNDIAIGQNADCLGSGNNIVIGSSTNSGYGIQSSVWRAIAIGFQAEVFTGQSDGICIGTNTWVKSGTGEGGISIGDTARGLGSSVVIGWNASHTSGGGSIVIGESASSSTSDATVIGKSATGNGGGSVAVGDLAQSPGTNSVAVGQGANAASTEAVAIGRNTYANVRSVALGYATCYGQYGTAIGYSSDVDAGCDYSIALGGSTSNAAHDFCIVIANAGGKSHNYGQRVFSNGRFGTNGDAQTINYSLRAYTTDATTTTLRTTSSSSDMFSTTPSGYAKIPSNSLATFQALVSAKRQDTLGDVAGYKIEGVIFNNGGTTSIKGTPTVTVLHEDDATWDVAIAADDTNDSLEINVTGAAGKSIRWLAEVTMVQIV